MPASQSDVHEDQVKLQERLKELVASEHGAALKQCLARYLLVKLNYTFELSEASTLDICSALLWTKETELQGAWGNHSRFLGSGSGASGVCSTEWMGIPCAKEFHLEEDVPSFVKEASILAHLKHPSIVNFFCCGNGEETGDRFIAMKPMEKSLYELIKLIKKQRVAYFSLHVVVDILVQIARGVCYLHDQGVAHRDLKPQNVVVNRLTSPHLVDHFDVKLVDFGMSNTKALVSKSNTASAPGVGTTNYSSPEVHPKAHLNGRGKVDWFEVGVFSFAMTCAHVLTLKKPFEDIILSCMKV